MSKTCPRCGQRSLREAGLNALSRRDNKTYICPPCGTDEAMHDFKLAQTKANESRWLEGASDKEEA